MLGGMQLEALLGALWADFKKLAPLAADIASRLEARGEKVQNDHIALRTLNRCGADLEAIETLLLPLGYRRLDEYHFATKHLRARAYVQAGQPRVFVSELLREELSPSAQATLERCVQALNASLTAKPSAELLHSGPRWPLLSHSEYERLSEESEYAGWLGAIGLRPNHFTVSVNALASLPEVADVLAFVEKEGFRINESGGRVKGTPAQGLVQGSTLADRQPVRFADGTHRIPTGYCEFAKRYPDAQGHLYEGFVPNSADRIFESTHRG